MKSKSLRLFIILSDKESGNSGLFTWFRPKIAVKFAYRYFRTEHSGKDYDWETFIPLVNPISYEMIGLLRQFQRTEANICEVVSLFIKAQYDIDYFQTNIPNKYLND